MNLGFAMCGSFCTFHKVFPVMEQLAQGGYEIVCANIVAGVLVRLMPVVPHFLKPDGVFLCSGILADREAEVRAAIESVGLQVIHREQCQQWCCLAAK